MKIIKFKAIHKGYTLISDKEFLNINKWRQRLFNLEQIGEYKEGEFKGIGYGNISIRAQESFVISGSKTGGIERPLKKDYARVVDYNINNNSVDYQGETKPSSEAMTHAAIYESNPSINAVIHIHNLKLFNKILNKVPTTREDVAYGTPEMAKEIIRLFEETDVNQQKILVMAGHKEGIITFGKDLEEAGNVLLNNL